MGVIVVVCAAFGLTVSEAKTEIMCIRAKGMPESAATFSVEAAGQVYDQTNEFVYLGGNANHNADLSIEVNRRIRNAWCSFQKYTLELYDRPSAPLELKIQMLRTEVLEAMLYGCVTWSPRACHYDTLRRVPHRFLTNCIGWRKNNRADHPISYLDTLITIRGGRGCNNFVPVLGGDCTKIAPTGDIFDQPPGGMISIRGKLADHVGDHVVLPPEGTVLVTSPGTESSYPRPPQ